MVVIKGMAMPERCPDCPITRKTKNGYRCQILSMRDGFSHVAFPGDLHRLPGCPLAEIKETTETSG